MSPVKRKGIIRELKQTMMANAAKTKLAQKMA